MTPDESKLEFVRAYFNQKAVAEWVDKNYNLISDALEYYQDRDLYRSTLEQSNELDDLVSKLRATKEASTTSGE